MNPLEYLTVALAAIGVIARIALFLPRPPKGPFRVV